MKSNEPQTVDRLTWYYENNRSITVVRKMRNSIGEYIKTEQFDIPLSMLEKSIKRISTPRSKNKVNP